jgi:hypothetical protein
MSELNHDLDYDHIDKMPNKQGCYDNGWVLIWCRTHKREEWHWVDYNKIPERLRPDPKETAP